MWLECDFLSQFLQWTTPASPWLEEAFVTYVGGKKDGNYEWQAFPFQTGRGGGGGSGAEARYRPK